MYLNGPYFKLNFDYTRAQTPVRLCLDVKKDSVNISAAGGHPEAELAGER